MTHDEAHKRAVKAASATEFRCCYCGSAKQQDTCPDSDRNRWPCVMACVPIASSPGAIINTYLRSLADQGDPLVRKGEYDRLSDALRMIASPAPWVKLDDVREFARAALGQAEAHPGDPLVRVSEVVAVLREPQDDKRRTLEWSHAEDAIQRRFAPGPKERHG